MTRETDDMAAQSLLSRLGRGLDAAKTKAELADELGWTERQVKLAVRDLRLGGWLVLAGNDGYWLEGDPQAWLKRQRSQIIAMPSSPSSPPTSASAAPSPRPTCWSTKSVYLRKVPGTLRSLRNLPAVT